jgi:hypothetical protein
MGARETERSGEDRAAAAAERERERERERGGRGRERVRSTIDWSMVIASHAGPIIVVAG